MALKQIKNKIKSTERTSKVTKAMEAVSAVKMRKSQEKALKGRFFAQAALRVLENITQSHEVKRHPYLTLSNGSHDCVIVITSDKGLAGNLNGAILKEASQLIKGKDISNVELICFGKKSYEYFTRRGYTIPKHFINISDDIDIAHVEDVVTFVTNQYKLGLYKNVHIVYQNFVSTFEQRAFVRQVLPINNNEVRTMIEDIRPKHGMYSEPEVVKFSSVYTIEQSYESLFASILNTLVEIMVYHALLESKASEHSARMVAMKNATDKARDVIKALTLVFNKERQSVITAEVSEITGGIEAMKNA